MTGLRILLAEDSPFNQKLALGVLGKRGHQLTVANNGSEAVNQAASRDFDLIFMDIQMPEMDGLEATKRIRVREGETGCRVPIIAMTAQAVKGMRERCLSVGMDDYLVKPVRAREIYDKIEALFASREVIAPAPRHAVARESALPPAKRLQVRAPLPSAAGPSCPPSIGTRRSPSSTETASFWVKSSPPS